MNNHLIAAAAAALTSVALSPAGAQPQTAYANDPIKIVRYAVAPQYSPPVLGWPWGRPNSESEAGSELMISFVNAGSVPATAVRFTVRSGERIETIVDKGIFTPGVGITHEFTAKFQPGDVPAIDVEAVNLADGTFWQRG